MSKILDLAKDFEKKSKQQANDTEQNLHNVFKQHETFIENALKSSAEKIESDIHAQNSRMNGLILRSWAWIMLTIVLVLAASTGLLMWTGNLIASDMKIIQQQSSTLEKLKAQTFGIQLIENREGRFIVLPNGIKVDPNWSVAEKNALKLVGE